MDTEFYITSVGALKYDRLHSISKLKYELKMFDMPLSYAEVKELLDLILSSSFEESIDRRMVYSLDEIFIGNEYSEIQRSDYF